MSRPSSHLPRTSAPSVSIAKPRLPASNTALDGSAAPLIGTMAAYSPVERATTRLPQLTSTETDEMAERGLVSIEPLFTPDRVVELSSLSPRTSAFGRLGSPSERHRLVEFIRQHWGRSLYFGVNPRSKTLLNSTRPADSSQIVERRVVGFDFDLPVHVGQGTQEADDWRAAIIARHAPFGPTLMVLSAEGGGLHIYYRIEPIQGTAAVNAATQEINELCRAIGSDPVGDAPRLMRMPWTPNIPTAKKLARGRYPALSKLINANGEARS